MQGSGAITVCCDQKCKSAVKLWLRFWMFQFVLLFDDKRIVSSLLGYCLWIILSSCDWWNCGAQWSVWRWPFSQLLLRVSCVPLDVDICTLISGIFTVLLVTEATIWSDSDSHFMKIQLPELRVYPVEWATSSFHCTLRNLHGMSLIF